MNDAPTAPGQRPTTPETIVTLEAIVAGGLCMGCGLCQSMAGADRVRLRMKGEHGERPVVLNALDDATLTQINAACPGIHCEGVAAPTTPEVEMHPLWGPTVWMATGHATDESVRFHASSGGALSALGNHLLESGEVDFLLHVAAARDAPLRTAATLSFRTTDVMDASGSRYGPAAPLIDFKAVLDRGRPFAFIGKPCDISAIRNYAKLDPRVDELLRYTLNFFCGGVSEFRKTMDYVRKVGLTEPEVRTCATAATAVPDPWS